MNLRQAAQAVIDLIDRMPDGVDCAEYDKTVDALRQALSVGYVPMTDGQLFSLSDGITVECEEDHMQGIKFLHEDEFVKYARHIELAAIKRAGLIKGGDA